jgi:hypothetical protein
MQVVREHDNRLHLERPPVHLSAERQAQSLDVVDENRLAILRDHREEVRPARGVGTPVAHESPRGNEPPLLRPS